MELIVTQLAKQNGVTNQLKAENQMEWLQQMNAFKAQAEAIVKIDTETALMKDGSLILMVDFFTFY